MAPTLDTLPDEILLKIHKALCEDFVHNGHWTTELGTRQLLKTAQSINLGRTNRHMRQIATEAMVCSKVFVVDMHMGWSRTGSMYMVHKLAKRTFLGESLSSEADSRLRIRHLEIAVSPKIDYAAGGYAEAGIIFRIDCDPEASTVSVKYSDRDRWAGMSRWAATQFTCDKLKQLLTSEASVDGLPWSAGLKLKDIQRLMMTIYSAGQQSLRAADGSADRVASGGDHSGSSDLQVTPPTSQRCLIWGQSGDVIVQPCQEEWDAWADDHCATARMEYKVLDVPEFDFKW